MAQETENTSSDSSMGPITKIVAASFKVTKIKLEGDGENYVEWKYLVVG